MRAVLCESLDGAAALRLRDVPAPLPGPQDVIVAVEAAALNFFDTLIVRGRYQFKPALPFAPGGEVAGRVVALGPDVQGLAIGQRVVGWAGFGGCAEQIAVPAARLVALPDGLSCAVAACLPIAYGTAMHGLIGRGALKPGETVAVLGASGGAGLAAIEIARLHGARTIAVASAAKLDAARAAGADETIAHDEQNVKAQLKALTGGRGVDIVYDCVGGALAEPALRACAWGGRHLVVGFAGGDIPRIPLNILLLKGCDLRGVMFSRHAAEQPLAAGAELAQIVGWAAAGRLRPVVEARHSLAETPAAIADIAARRVTGKRVVEPTR